MAQATRSKVWQLSTLVLAAALGAMMLARRAEAVAQPNMEVAQGHLEQAKASLEKGEHNKGGYRLRAYELTNQAIAAVREGIAVGNR